MAESYSIVAELQAKVDGFVNGFKQAQSQVEGFVKQNTATFDSFKKVGAAATAGGVAVAAGLGGAVKIAADFEAGMSKVQAISGASGDEMVKLTAKAREMGSKTKFSASEASDAFSYMAMAGWKTTDMLDGIAPVMDLAAASGEDLALTADILTDGLTAFGLSAKDGSRMADVMSAASSNANTNVAMLGESFKYVAPLAGAMGYSIEDTSLALGLMANAGVKGSQAGTSLKTMFTNLAKPTKQMQNAMDDLGISLTDNDGNMKSMETVLGELRTSFADLDEAQQAQYAATIFGKEAMAGALAVINASDEDYNKLKDSIDNSKGAAAEMAAVMQDNLSGALTNLNSALEEAAISLGNALLPVVKMAVDIVQSLADKFNSLDDKTKTIIAIIAALAAGFLLLTGPILMLIGFIPSMLAGFTALSTVFAAVTGPIGLAIAAVVAIVAAVIAAYHQFEWFRDGVQAVWTAVVDVIMSAVEGVVSFVKEIADQISTYWNENGELIRAATENVWNAISAVISAVLPVIQGIIKVAMTAIKIVVQSVWNNIKGVIKGALDIILGLVKTFSGLFTGDFKAMWEGVKQLFKGAVDFLWNAVQLMLWGRMLKGVAAFAGTFRGNITNMWNAIKSVFTNAINAIKNFFTSGFNAMQKVGSTSMNSIKSVVTTAWNAIKNVFTTVINAVKNTVSSGFSNVVSAIRSKMSEALSAVKNIMSNMISTVTGAVGKFASAGKDMIRGLINGIKSMTTAAIGAITGVVDGVVNKAKSLLRIASPSKVFEQIGAYTGEGLVIGMSSTVRDVAAAAAGLADAAFIDVPGNNFADQINAVNRQASRQFQSDFTNRVNVQRQPAVINVHVGSHQIAQEIVDDISRLQSDDYGARRAIYGY